MLTALTDHTTDYSFSPRILEDEPPGAIPEEDGYAADGGSESWGAETVPDAPDSPEWRIDQCPISVASWGKSYNWGPPEASNLAETFRPITPTVTPRHGGNVRRQLGY